MAARSSSLQKKIMENTKKAIEVSMIKNQMEFKERQLLRNYEKTQNVEQQVRNALKNLRDNYDLQSITP